MCRIKKEIKIRVNVWEKFTVFFLLFKGGQTAIKWKTRRTVRQRGGECRRWDTGGCGGEQRSGNYNGESSERVLQTPSPISRQLLQTKSSEANKGENFWEALVAGEGRKEYLSPLKSWQETATTLLKEPFKGRRSWAVGLSSTSTPSPAHSPGPCPEGEGFGLCCLSRLGVWNAPKLLSLGAQLCQILIQLFWREVQSLLSPGSLKGSTHTWIPMAHSELQHRQILPAARMFW